MRLRDTARLKDDNAQRESARPGDPGRALAQRS